MATNANKRARKKRRAEPQDEPEFQVAPMIDVLLVLTLFFMSITSTEILKKDPKLVLPDASAARKPDPNEKKGQVIVNINWDHNNKTAGISIDGHFYSDATAIQGYLAQRVAADPRTYALVRADKDVQYSNVSDVMGSCAAAGISKVSFAVITSGNQAHKAAVQAATPAATGP